jgi:hypothetical protein
MSAEQTETLRQEVLVAFRRLGQNRVHFALVMPDLLVPSTHLGASCTRVTAPIAAWCGRTLRGDLVEIPKGFLDGWRKNGHVCRECVLVGQMGVKLHEERHG